MNPLSQKIKENEEVLKTGLLFEVVEWKSQSSQQRIMRVVRFLYMELFEEIKKELIAMAKEQSRSYEARKTLVEVAEIIDEAIQATKKL